MLKNSHPPGVRLSVPFADARHLEDYVVLEQIRFKTDLQVEHFMIPPMLLQPLVENAVRRGLNPKPEGGTITLRTRVDGNWVRALAEREEERTQAIMEKSGKMLLEGEKRCEKLEADDIFP